jgi:hypothetical protein
MDWWVHQKRLTYLLQMPGCRPTWQRILAERHASQALAWGLGRTCALLEADSIADGLRERKEGQNDELS